MELIGKKFKHRDTIQFGEELVFTIEELDASNYNITWTEYNEFEDKEEFCETDYLKEDVEEYINEGIWILE